MASINPDQARFLVQARAHPEFQRTYQLLRSGTPELPIRKGLEAHFSPEQCRALLDCLACQLRFAHKFAQAESWLLTRSAAEQASDSRIAEWRAQFLEALAGGCSLSELGCGIGGDSVFLSRYFCLQTYEANEARSILAQENIAQLGVAGNLKASHPEATVETLEGEILFCDPARRLHKRISNPEEWLPPLSAVARCLQQKRFRLVAIKAAPGVQERDLDCLGGPVDISYISLDGELKEAFLVVGGEAQEQSVRSRAILLDRTNSAPVLLESKQAGLSVGLPQPGGFLHNPDPAILRASALDTLAQQLQAHIVHPKIGYLVGERACQNSTAQSFQILETFPLNWAILKKKLQATGWTEYEYLARGVPFSQTDIRNKLPKLKRRNKKQTAKRGAVIVYRDESDYRVVLGVRVDKGMSDL